MPAHLHIAYEYIYMVMAELGIGKVATDDMESSFIFSGHNSLYILKIYKKQNPHLGETVDLISKFDNDPGEKDIILYSLVRINYL